MILQDHYEQLWKTSAEAFSRGHFELDPDIDNPTDTRHGLTLLIRPSDTVKAAWLDLRSRLEAIEPDQYYYPVSDLHVTVMAVISCYPGFSLNSIDLPAYTTLIKQALHNSSTFNINFAGITASPSCILLQGFPSSGALDALRNNIRNVFRSGNLSHSIDKRYALQTAHATVVRFRQPLKNPTRFLDALHEYRQYTFGQSPVQQVDLVFNDWYQRSNKVTLLDSFKLGD